MGRTLRSVVTLLCTAVVLSLTVSAHAATYTDQAARGARRRVPAHPAEAERFVQRVLHHGLHRGRRAGVRVRGRGPHRDDAGDRLSAPAVSPRPRDGHRLAGEGRPGGGRRRPGSADVRRHEPAADDPRHDRHGRALRRRSAVFDDALAVLAIESAEDHAFEQGGRVAAVGAVPDGGWAYDKPYDAGTDNAHCVDSPSTDFFSSDSNTTSYVVQALANMSDTDWVSSPFAFFDVGARPGAPRLALLRRVPRDRRELHGARAPGVRAAGAADAHAQHPGAARPAVRPCAARSRSRGARASAAAPTRGDDRRDPRSAARCVPGERAGRGGTARRAEVRMTRRG